MSAVEVPGIDFANIDKCQTTFIYHLFVFTLIRYSDMSMSAKSTPHILLFYARTIDGHGIFLRVFSDWSQRLIVPMGSLPI